MNRTSKHDIITKLDITDSIYESWEKINKTQLKKINLYLEKKQMKSKLKIRNIPEINCDSDSSTIDTDPDSDMDNKFLRKEPGYEHHQIHIDKRTTTLLHRKNQIQEKINKLIDLENNKKIGQNEFHKAMNILQDEMENVNKLLKN
jgi:hypothetical protein